MRETFPLAQIPHCPTDLPIELQELLRRFARSWAASVLRPMPELHICTYWDGLISAWANEPDLPLFIRKPSAGRGQFLSHQSGRILIPVDNSPPHWSFISALKGLQPDLQEIRNSLAGDEIPIAMILKKEEKEHAKLMCTRVEGQSLNSAGWKLGHIVPVGLKGSAPLTEMPVEKLREHFIKLMSPSNMFLVPLSLAGLAEMPAMIEELNALGPKTAIRI